VTFPVYKELKDTKNSWLGFIPSHWSCERFKHVYRERVERSVDGTEVLLSVSGYTGVRPRSEIVDEGESLSRAETLSGYKLCRAGDLVMNIMLAWNRALGVSEHTGIVSPAYCVFECVSNNELKFLHYLLRSDEYTRYFKAFSSGVIDSRLRLYPDAFMRLECIVPPLNEQRQIARFLDRETAKIDDLVAEQERLIALLKEKRHAVISHAVTKGLNPDARMKDSGIRFLGAVPKHWKLASLKNFISLSTSGPRGWSDRVSDEGALFFQSQNIGLRMDVKLENAKRISVPPGTEAQRAKLSVGDVVVCITGARTGAVAHVNALDVEAYVNQHVCLLRPDQDKVYSRFLAYVLISSQVQEQLGASTYGLKQGLGLEDLRSTVVPIPENAEAVSIVEYLDSTTSVLDQLVEEADRSIRLLQERRSALISAAVTGKIDVRGLVNTEEAA